MDRHNQNACSNDFFKEHIAEFKKTRIRTPSEKILCKEVHRHEMYYEKKGSELGRIGRWFRPFFGNLSESCFVGIQLEYVSPDFEARCCRGQPH